MDTALITFLANAGTAGVFLVLLVTGVIDPGWVRRKLEQENQHLREALELERQRSEEASRGAGVTNQLIGALVDLAGERKAVTPGKGDAGGGPGLTWKDISLCGGGGGRDGTSGSARPAPRLNGPAVTWNRPAPRWSPRWPGGGSGITSLNCSAPA